MATLKAIAFVLAGVLPGASLAEPVLLMAEERGCYWCGRWNAEIGPIYPKTAEGRIAPLQRFDLHSETPAVTFERPVRFTPTFILVEDGQELGRIEGYPGEDFFWGLLSIMFDKADISISEGS